jgi:hypothetical protein
MNRRHFFARMAAALSAHAAVSVPCTAMVVPDPVHEVIDDCPVVLPPEVEMPAWLKHWRGLPRRPVWESTAPDESMLIAAAERSIPVSLIYHAGSTPGLPRTFTPSLLFRTAEGVEAPLYVSGWCHHRQAHRTLRVDQITLNAASFSTLKRGATHPSLT